MKFGVDRPAAPRRGVEDSNPRPSALHRRPTRGRPPRRAARGSQAAPLGQSRASAAGDVRGRHGGADVTRPAPPGRHGSRPPPAPPRMSSRGAAAPRGGVCSSLQDGGGGCSGGGERCGGAPSGPAAAPGPAAPQTPGTRSHRLLRDRAHHRQGQLRRREAGHAPGDPGQGEEPGPAAFRAARLLPSALPRSGTAGGAGAAPGRAGPCGERAGPGRGPQPGGAVRRQRCRWSPAGDKNCGAVRAARSAARRARSRCCPASALVAWGREEGCSCHA